MRAKRCHARCTAVEDRCNAGPGAGAKTAIENGFAIVAAKIGANVAFEDCIDAIRRVFGEDNVPPIASTKSLTGHSLGATGVHEAIYSLIMMEKGFIAPSINVTELDPALKPHEIVTELREGVEFDSVLSNSFGFGGTNATLAFSKMQG